MFDPGKDTDAAIDLLEDLINFLDKYADVRDGPEGEVLPNKAMSLQLRCIEARRQL